MKNGERLNAILKIGLAGASQNIYVMCAREIILLSWKSWKRDMVNSWGKIEWDKANRVRQRHKTGGY